MDDNFCDGCIHLSIEEDEQTRLKYAEYQSKKKLHSYNRMLFEHKCHKYNKVVKHLGQHPHICRLGTCINRNGKEMKEHERSDRDSSSRDIQEHDNGGIGGSSSSSTQGNNRPEIRSISESRKSRSRFSLLSFLE